ncbi:hypothetical protein MPSEU_000021000 [Mayamaea pseudoterrestris]|nr:hypothetical protein MPSEU_000021000 [Mayamaea pseudoterrestris]
MSRNNQQHHHGGSNNKRRAAGNASHARRSDYNNEEEEDQVDDLAVAASYAMSVAVAAPAVRPDDDNEIDLMAGNEADEGANATDKLHENEAAAAAAAAATTYRLDPSLIYYDSDDSSSSSDESNDKDADASLAKMLEECDDDEDGHDDGPPRTTHEITDPTAALLDKRLTLDEKDALGRVQEQLQVEPPLSMAHSNKHSSRQQQQSQQQQSQQQPLQVAGTVHQYIVSDQMLVVQSSLNGAVLQPGTLLVMRLPDRDDDSTLKIVACGKILDVFGPVRQPLYSVHVGITAVEAKLIGNDKPVDEVTDEQTESLGGTDATSVVGGTDAAANATTTKTTTSSKVLINPWSANGIYTKYINNLKQQQQAISVYYISDCASVLDPSTLPQTKGCDASNAHDEEVLHPTEMDYSDDEQEQQAKRSNRRGSGGRNQPMTSSMQQQQYPTRASSGYATGRGVQPQGFHGYPVQQQASQQPNLVSEQLQQQHSLAVSPPPTNTATLPAPDSDVVYYNF